MGAPLSLELLPAAARGAAGGAGGARRSRSGGRALIIEQDGDYASLMAVLLQRDGWEADRAGDARAGIDRLVGGGATGRYDVVLLNTPAALLDDGRSPLGAIRAATSVPVIALSEDSGGDEQLESGVEQAIEGADYNLVKPFSPRRFRAAVRAVARRGRAPSGMRSRLPTEVQVGSVTMSYGRLEVTVGGRRVELSPREFALLHLLIAHPGTVFTRDELARLAWGWHSATDSRAVDNTIQRIRRKLEPNPRTPTYVLTERGTGYYFAEGPGPATG
jgi:two-component system response regulator VicR